MAGNHHNAERQQWPSRLKNNAEALLETLVYVSPRQYPFRVMPKAFPQVWRGGQAPPPPYPPLRLTWIFSEALGQLDPRTLTNRSRDPKLTIVHLLQKSRKFASFAEFAIFVILGGNWPFFNGESQMKQKWPISLGIWGVTQKWSYRWIEGPKTYKCCHDRKSRTLRDFWEIAIFTFF